MNTLLQECEVANNEIKDTIEYDNFVRNQLDSEQRDIANYCNNLKVKFKNIAKTFSEYEKNIDILKKDNHGLTTAYAEKVSEIGNSILFR